jgi:glycine cleavage system H lipoate-binding protein/ABC-type phosphate transport system substrate-binding protein
MVMKNTVLGFIGLLLIYCGNLYSGETVAQTNQRKDGELNILTTPGLFSLTNRLAGEYNSLKPGVTINMITSEIINKESLHESGINSGFVQGDQIAGPDTESLWKMTIGRDIIVPVINANNPFIEKLNQNGISADKLSVVFKNSEQRVWGSLIPEGKNMPVHIFVVNDESVIRGLKKFLGLDQLPDWIRLINENELIAAVQNEPDAIAFCRLTDISGIEKLKFAENIKLLPIDKNGNGKLDYSEEIYTDPESFSRGVWIGKYPRALYTEIYYVASSQPSSEDERAFIKWILTDGQQLLNAGGFSDLAYSERQSKLDKLNPVSIVMPSEEVYSFPKMAVIILSAIVVISLIISSIIFYRRNKKISSHTGSHVSTGVFSENSVIAPKGLYFDKTHTWAFMEKSGLVRIGIDDFIQHVTGPVTRVDLKMPGERIKKGDIALSLIQKGKQLNIYAPVSGTIREHNNALLADSSCINTSPYSEGWIYMIEPSNWLREIQFFDMAEKYRKWLQNEFLRLKDFLATSIKVNKNEYEYAVLQDGGALRDSILENLGPEVWEDFQSNFLDANK